MLLGRWARKLGHNGWNEFGKILWKGPKIVEDTLQHECYMRLRVGYLTVWTHMPCQKALLESPGGIQLSPLGVDISKLWLPPFPPQHHFLAPDFHSLRWFPPKPLAQVFLRSGNCREVEASQYSSGCHHHQKRLHNIFYSRVWETLDL